VYQEKLGKENKKGNFFVGEVKKVLVLVVLSKQVFLD